MSMGFLDDEDDSDSFFDNPEDVEAQLGEEPPAAPAPVGQRQSSAAAKSPQTTKTRKFRFRPMPPTMAAKRPDLVSVLMTRRDGTQIMLVRG